MTPVTPAQKDAALEQIRAIAQAHALSAQQVFIALLKSPATAGDAAAAEDKGSLLSRLMGYIGGIFIFSGICVFISMQWDEIGSFARVLLTLGLGFAAYIASLSAYHEKKYARAALPLTIVAAIFQPMGILVLLDEYSSGGPAVYGTMFMASLMLVQQGLTYAHLRRYAHAITSVIFACLLFGALVDSGKLNDGVQGFLVLAGGLATLVTACTLARKGFLDHMLVPVLFIAALFLQGLGVQGILDDYGLISNPQAAGVVISLAFLCQTALLFRLMPFATLAFVTMGLFSAVFVSLLDLMGAEEDIIALLLGLALLPLTRYWHKTPQAAIAPFWYATGAICLLGGFFAQVKGEIYEALFLGLSVGLMYMSVSVRSRTLLIVSTIAMISYIGYYCFEYFADTVGVAITFILLGVLFLGLGSLALRLNNKYIRKKEGA